MLGSHRATVAILEILTKVQAYFSIDPELIQGIKRWVQLRQEDDGSFLPLPADVKLTTSTANSASKTPLNNDTFLLEHIIEITAETVISLFEIGIESDADSDTLQKAKIFLENGLPKIESSATIATVTLALVLVRSVTTPWAIEKLRNASTTEDGEFGWPHLTPKRDAADWLYESEAGRSLKEPLVATMEDYKASIFALSTFCFIRDLKFAESITRYLFYRSHLLDRHPELLYLAVKAFSQFDTLAKDKHRALTISLATSGMELTDTLELKPSSSPQLLHLPSLPTKVFVYATGAGCATVQGKTTYSTYSTQSRTSLLELWSGVVQEILPDRSSVEEIEGKLPMLKIKTCFSWKDEVPSGVLRLEVSLFSGFELASTPPSLLDAKENVLEMQHGSRGNNLWFIFANISNSCPICVQYLARSAFVISALRPAYARIYPATREDLSAETFFHTRAGSYLLKGIADDDVITWFGKNGTTVNDVPKEDKCKPAPQESNNGTTNFNTPYPHKMENLTIVTYTINVEEGRRNSTHDDKVLIEPVAVTPHDKEKLSNSNVTEIKLQSSDEIILQIKNARNATTLAANANFTKKSMVDRKKIKLAKQGEFKASTVASADVSISTKAQELVVDMNVAPPKHINTQKQEIPMAYLDKNKINDDYKVTFAPEEKNDKYVLLDKEELWGMLKEVVSDEIKKSSSKMADVQKQSLT